MSNAGEQVVDNSQAPLENVVVIKQPEGAKNEENKGTGVFFMMMTLMSSRVGAGLVGVPYATDLVGYTFALCFQIGYVPIGIFS
jgi:hypothetical protein